MSVRMKRQGWSYVFWRSLHPWMVLVQSRSGPFLKKQVQYIHRFLKRLLQFSFQSELVRQVSPGQRPLKRHEWKENQYWSNYQKFIN